MPHKQVAEKHGAQFDALFDEFLKNTVQEIHDHRFNRWVLNAIGVVLYFGIELDEFHKGFNPYEIIRSNAYLAAKKISDWENMQPSFRRAISEAKRDPASRQIMVLNTNHYERRQPCFLSFQFLCNESGENNFTLIIFQRSASKEKFLADLLFFGYVIKTFEKFTGYRVTEMAIHYGSFHKEIKK